MLAHSTLKAALKNVIQLFVAYELFNFVGAVISFVCARHLGYVHVDKLLFTYSEHVVLLK